MTNTSGKRLSFLALVVAALAAWWVGDRFLDPWLARLAGYEHIANRDLSIVISHWCDQLPRLLLCVCIWLVGSRLGLMPSLRDSFASGGSWHRVVRSGLMAALISIVLTVGIGAAAGGVFGFHLYWPKMAGDLVSNMYEEVVYRGLMFCAFYGLAAGASFPLAGKLNRGGVTLGIIGSCFVFAFAHEQYDVALRIVVGALAAVLAYPWIAARSLWGAWIAHTLGDIVIDTILKL